MKQPENIPQKRHLQAGRRSDQKDDGAQTDERRRDRWRRTGAIQRIRGERSWDCNCACGQDNWKRSRSRHVNAAFKLVRRHSTNEMQDVIVSLMIMSRSKDGENFRGPCMMIACTFMLLMM